MVLDGVEAAIDAMGGSFLCPTRPWQSPPRAPTAP